MAQTGKGVKIYQEKTGFQHYAQGGGELVFLDSGGNDGNNGFSPREAVATLARAQAIALAGDTIIVLPGGSETITATVEFDVANVKVICPSGSINPQSGYAMSAAGTIDMITVSAADVHIEGLKLIHTGTTANASGILVETLMHRTKIKNCVFDDKDISSTKTGTGVELTSGGDDQVVEGCLFLDCKYGVNVVASSTAVSDRMKIEKNTFFTGGSAFFSIFAPQASGALQAPIIKDNLFIEADADGSSAGTAWDGSDNTNATQGPITMGANVDQYLITGCRAYTALAQAFNTINAINSGAAGDIVDSATGTGSDTSSAVDSVGTLSSQASVGASRAESSAVLASTTASTAHSTALLGSTGASAAGSSAVLASTSASTAHSTALLGSTGASAAGSSAVLASTSGSNAHSVALLASTGASSAGSSAVLASTGGSRAESSAVLASTGASTAHSTALLGSTGASSAGSSAVLASTSASTAHSTALLGSTGASSAGSSAVLASTSGSAAGSSAVLASTGGSRAESSAVLASTGASSAHSAAILAGQPVARASSLNDSAIDNNTQSAGARLCTADGAVMIEEVTLAKDASALTGPTNVELTSDNVYGLTGINVPHMVEAIGALQANENINATEASGTAMVPFVLEAGKKLYLHGDNNAGTSGGTTAYAIKGRALSAGGKLDA